MNSHIPSFKKTILFFTVFTATVWLTSCGRKTVPQALPESKPVITIKDLNAKRMGSKIRLSWTIYPEERQRALKLSESSNDFFEISHKVYALSCLTKGKQTCTAEHSNFKRFDWKNKDLIREGNLLYYYLPQFQNSNSTEQANRFHEFRLSHLDENEDILSPVLEKEMEPSAPFPAEIPEPVVKIVQTETQDQVLQFPFGTVAVFKLDETENEPNSKNSSNETASPKKGNSPVLIAKKYTLRLSWENASYWSKTRFDGSGDFYEQKKVLQANLYRTDDLHKWKESPINNQHLQDNYFLDKVSIRIMEEIHAPFLADTHPGV